jgi:hypothetical protein
MKEIPTNIGREELFLTLFDREKYGIYLPMLTHSLKTGVKVKRYQTVVQFIQKPFMKYFVQPLIYLRKMAQTHTLNQLCKFFLNSCYGDFGLDPETFKHVWLVTGVEKALELLTNPYFYPYLVLKS